MIERMAVYAGSFDPPTVGHLWMIEQGAALFDRLRVAVGLNPEKKSLFGVEERLAMLREITSPFPNVEVHAFTHQYLVRYAKAVGAKFILRGIRSETDYEYERGMRNVNGDLDQAISTVFLMPPRGIAEVSSSLVKAVTGPEGWEDVVRGYVPGPIFDHLVSLRDAVRK
jgi:pantetheine-phosphate adenylyltransferase